VAEQPDIECGMTLGHLPNDKTGQRHEDCYEHAGEERRNKPFEIIAHIDERLDAEEDHDKQNKTDAVEAGEKLRHCAEND
jgi:hypothetical protein